MENGIISKLKLVIMPVIVIIVLALVFFLSAGTIMYWHAWIYLTVFSVLTLFITFYFLRRSPGLLARRQEIRDQESVRKIPSFLKLFLLLYPVSGLDFRFHWSVMPVSLVIAANFVVCLGYLLIIRVFKENSFASSAIKIEDKQQIITKGPYAIVRHPMYAGMLVMTMSTPLALGSYWALIPCIFFIPWLYLRIKYEEKLLLKELPGYSEYCRETTSRLIPFIW